MKVYISNHLSDDVLGSVANQIKSLLPGALDGVVDNLLRKGGNTRAQQALYSLRWIQENGRPFKVYTPHCVFDNMIIKDITFETGDDTMDTLVAEITFVELLMYAPLGDISSQPKRESVINNQTSERLSRFIDPVKGLF